MDERLRFYEAEWKKERDARMALQQQTGTSESQLSRLQQQTVRLQGDVEALRRALSAAETAAEAARAKAERLTHRSDRLQTQLETLRLDAVEPTFWQDLAATPLGEALDAFERLPDVTEGNFTGDVSELALEATQLLAELETDYQDEKAERLWGLLTAQWVYARWLEVTSGLGK